MNCARGAVDTPDTGTYDPSMLRYAAGKGDLYTQIVGNPFNASKDKVESVVTGRVAGATRCNTLFFDEFLWRTPLTFC
ncbi:MAG: hypothetical protein IIA34_09115 [Proteobacteria bacterium]|nr:hypothetical protein [Pseudomonadota bacterium]